MLAQITAGSLLGDFGNGAKKAAEYFVENNLAHVIASDMHRPRQARLPHLSAAFERTVELVGAEQARRLFEDTPRNLIDGRDPDLDTPRFSPGRSRRKWWPFGGRQDN
jgi:protein-tyrosine phosphatase